MSKVIKMIWYSTSIGTVGIALTDNGIEKRAYVGSVVGRDEEIDAISVKEYGGRISIEQVEEILKHLKQQDGKTKEPKKET